MTNLKWLRNNFMNSMQDIEQLKKFIKFVLKEINYE